MMWDCWVVTAATANAKGESVHTVAQEKWAWKERFVIAVALHNLYMIVALHNCFDD